MSRHRLASGGIHRCMDSIAWLQPVSGDLDAMPNCLALRLHIDDPSRGALPGQQPGVGRLSAALGGKGRLVQKNVRVLWLSGHRENIRDRGIAFEPVVSDEPAGAPGERRGEARGGGPAAITLTLHQGSHSLEVDAHAALRGEFGSEFDREAKRVMEVEHFFGVKSSALEQRLYSLHSLAQRYPEALFFRPYCLSDPIDLLFDFGIDVTQQAGNDWHA